MVISGSYNWTKNAIGNSENVTIFVNGDIAMEYQIEFDRLLKDAGILVEDEPRIYAEDELPIPDSLLDNLLTSSFSNIRDLILKKDFFSASAIIDRLYDLAKGKFSHPKLLYLRYSLFLNMEEFVKSYLYLMRLLDFYTSLSSLHENEVEPLKSYFNHFKSVANCSETTLSCYEELNSITTQNESKMLQLNLIPFYYDYDTVYSNTLPF